MVHTNHKTIHIDIEVILKQFAPSYWQTLPLVLHKPIVRFFHHLLSVNRIEKFMQDHRGVRGFNLIDDLFDMLEVSFLVSSRELERIPATGKVVCVSNHPLGGLDGLVILKAIHEVRPDVRIVVSNVLLVLNGLVDLFLPVDVFTKSSTRAHIHRIDEALEHEEAVVFFPSAEVSRMSLRGVTDTKWHTGAV